MIELAAAALVILLRDPEGREVRVSPGQITSLRSGVPGKPNSLAVPGARCMVGLTDGKFVSVIETCAQIQTMMEAR